MGKAVAYVIVVVFGLALWSYSGLFDGLFDRGNLEERAKFREGTVAREAPKGTSKTMVDAMLAKHGITLECFHSSDTPPVADCIADDPASKGGPRSTRWLSNFASSSGRESGKIRNSPSPPQIDMYRQPRLGGCCRCQVIFQDLALQVYQEPRLGWCPPRR